MKRVQLRDDTIVAGYDHVRPAFQQSASEARLREYSAVPVDLMQAGYMGQGMVRRTNGSHLATMPPQGCRESSR
jgi:hypothetical protein